MIVKIARERGWAGAKLSRGIEGLGAKSRAIHTDRILRIPEDLPVVVERADTELKIMAFQPIVDDLLGRAGASAMTKPENIDVIRHENAGMRDHDRMNRQVEK